MPRPPPSGGVVYTPIAIVFSKCIRLTLSDTPPIYVSLRILHLTYGSRRILQVVMVNFDEVPQPPPSDGVLYTPYLRGIYVSLFLTYVFLHILHLIYVTRRILQVVMVDLDEVACKQCREHLPTWNEGVYEDPRCLLHKSCFVIL